MKLELEVETHSHTLVTNHAYSTVTEMLNHAASIGLKGVCVTDHGPMIENGVPHPFYFDNLGILPRKIAGVYLIKGAELNLCDYSGKVDLTESQLKSLEWTLASIHTPCLAPADTEKITDTYLAALNNPLIDALGHIGQPKYFCDYERIVREAKKLDKVIEINNNSVRVRKGSYENCVKIAKLCKQYEVRVCVSTDAHYHMLLGKWDSAFSILEAASFPEELIVNRNIQTFRDYILERRRIDIFSE